MSIQKYCDEMANIQIKLHEFLDCELKAENKYQDLKNIFDDIKIYDNRHQFKSILHLLLKISNNYHQKSNFFDKIGQIIKILENCIKQYFTNSEIFDIFKSNKRLLLYLFESNILKMDENIVKQMITGKYLLRKYPQYFSPEIRPFINTKYFNESYYQLLIKEINTELPKNFYQARKNGQNDSKICDLIRNDSIDDFVSYMNRTNHSISGSIEASIYETNNFLLKQKTQTLIEYASFFGSIRIFNYLKSKGVKLTTSLWRYSIHGQNLELIQILEQNHIDPKDEDEEFIDYLKEAIKCHHNELSNYIINQYLSKKDNENEDENEEESEYSYENDILIYGLKYYNFTYVKYELIDKYCFKYLVQYDYYIIVNLLINSNHDFDINKPIISNNI